MRSKCDKRRQAIVECAAGVFQEKGIENASMADIVARMGGSKATLYNYFPSKEALLNAVVCFSAERQREEAFAQLDAGGDLREILEGFGRRHLRKLMDPCILAAIRLAQQDADRCDTGRQFWEQGPKQGWTEVGEFLRRCMDAGALRESDSWVAAVHLKSLLESEILGPRLFGVFTEVSDEQIEGAVRRGVDSFLRAYALSEQPVLAPA